jgi:hypothetical protein
MNSDRSHRFRKLSAITVAAYIAGGTSLVHAQQGNLKPETIDNTRNMRFCEILVVKFRGVEVYNTTGTALPFR